MTLTRHEGKKELNRAIGNIDWCLHHIKQFLEMGYAEREEFAKYGLMITQSLIEIQNAIVKLKDKI